MARDPIAARYAQALFESAKAEQRVDEVLETLTLVGALVRERAELRQLLLNPDVDPEDKAGILSRVLKGSCPDMALAFFRVVVSFGRESSLPDMAEAFSAMVDEDRGYLRAVVRSARPLSDPALQRLRASLARREHRQVELRLEIAPELLGGLQVQLGQRVIDGSIRRQLSELRQRLQSVRVY